MKERLLRIARWASYPLFYLFCLALFGYLTFPFAQLKGRIIAEFDRMQQKERRRPGEEPMRLQIDELDGYWLSGVEVTGARLIIPPKPKRSSPVRGMGGLSNATPKEDAAPKPAELLIDRASARVRILPLLLGNVLVDFDAEAFGGSIEGTLPVGADSGDVDLSFENLELSRISPIGALLEGVPVSGLASGEVHLSPKEAKFSKADGNLSITIEGVKLGSKMKNEETGKLEDVVEIQGIRIPAVQVGTLVISGTAVDGILTLDQFVGRGRDFELVGEGKIKLAEQWENAQADISVKFRFTDTYRTSSAAATSLLGKPGDTIPPLIEMGPSPLRSAKTEDGYYRFQLSGKLGSLEPKAAGSGGGKSARRPGRTTPAPRPGRPQLKPDRPGLRLPQVAPRAAREEEDEEERRAQEREEREQARREPPREEPPREEPPREEPPREEPQHEPPPDEAREESHDEGPAEAPQSGEEAADGSEPPADDASPEGG